MGVICYVRCDAMARAAPRGDLEWFSGFPERHGACCAQRGLRVVFRFLQRGTVLAAPRGDLE